MVTVNKRFCRMVSQKLSGNYREIETIILKVQTSEDHAVGLLYVLHGNWYDTCVARINPYVTRLVALKGFLLVIQG